MPRAGAALALGLLLGACPAAPVPADAEVNDDQGRSAERPRPPESPRIPWLGEGEPDVAAPAIPWLDARHPPMDWTCEGGWRPVDTEGVRTCEPYGPQGPAACGEGEAHFPGEPICRPIGAACGDGPFPDVAGLPEGAAVVYVLATAAPGGGGVPEAPFRTLPEALDAVEQGSVVVLGAGAYEVDRTWPDGVSLRGLCVRETSLVAAAGDDRSAIVDVARHEDPIRLEHVRIGPGDTVGLRIRRSGAPVVVDGVEIIGVIGDPAGLVVTSGARVEARSVVVRSTQGPGRGQLGGLGIEVSAGGELSLTDGVVAQNRSIGVVVFRQGSRLIATDLRVTGTLGRSGTGTEGFGLRVEDGGLLELTRALVDGNRDAGVVAFGPGARVDATELIIRNTLVQEVDGDFGRGLSAELDARAEIRRGLIERHPESAVFVSSGADVGLSEVVIRDAVSAGSTTLGDGRGFTVQDGGRLRLGRAVVTDARGAGVFTTSPGSEVTITDAVIRRTRSRLRDGLGGDGIAATGDARVVVRRALIEASVRIGLAAAGAETVVEAQDLVLWDESSDTVEARQAGIVMQEGAHLVLGRARVEGSAGVGLWLQVGTSAEVDDLGIDETVAAAPSSAGIVVEEGSELRLERAVLRRNSATGLSVEGGDARVTDLLVQDTLPRLLDGPEPRGGGGRGVEVFVGGRAELTRAVVEGSRNAGLLLDDDGTEADIHDLVLRDTLPQAGEDGASVAGELGRGLVVQGGARRDLARAVLERNREVGLAVLEEGTALHATDLHVRDILPQELDGRFGQGIIVQELATVSLERVRVEGCHTSGLAFGPGVEADAVDLHVRDTGSSGTDGSLGHGVAAGLGATVRLEHGRIEGNREVGISAVGEGTVVDLADVIVRGTSAPDCHPACAGQPAGVGLGAYGGSSIRATDFLVEGSQTCGVQLAAGGRIELQDGEVRGHPIAICLQVPGFPVSLLRQNVAYRGNDVVIDTATRPAPDSVDEVLPLER
ncbi:MAG: hypothetical protein ACFCGT_04285 [Sandaracinaceae bacterium]